MKRDFKIILKKLIEVNFDFDKTIVILLNFLQINHSKNFTKILPLLKFFKNVLILILIILGLFKQMVESLTKFLFSVSLKIFHFFLYVLFHLLKNLFSLINNYSPKVKNILVLLISFIKTNILMTGKHRIIKKKIFYNIYSIFPNKILITGTVILSFYSILWLITISNFSIDFLTPLNFLINFNILYPFVFLQKIFFSLELFPLLSENIYYIRKEEIFFECLSKSFFNKETYFHKETYAITFILILVNGIHSLIAYYSLFFDYLLKKTTLENITIIFVISSTILHIFVREIYPLFILCFQ